MSPYFFCSVDCSLVYTKRTPQNTVHINDITIISVGKDGFGVFFGLKGVLVELSELEIQVKYKYTYKSNFFFQLLPLTNLVLYTVNSQC